MFAYLFTDFIFVGTLSDMPAVNTFAIYATLALLFVFIFQTTAFVALLAIDENRYRVSKFFNINLFLLLLPTFLAKSVRSSVLF